MSYEHLNEQTVCCGRRGIERKLWALEAAGPDPTAAIVFLDAELYIERVMAPQSLIADQKASGAPGIAAVFVSNNGPLARQQDFVCNENYAAFIAQDVVEWVQRGNPGVEDDIVIAGLSLSGLAAAYIATCYPETFRAAICQSPSFWWENGRFARDAPPAQSPAPALWISVGDEETDAGIAHPPYGLFQGACQFSACDAAVTALRAAGYGAHYRVFAGGHDPACWSEDLELALRWAFPAQQYGLAPNRAVETVSDSARQQEGE